MDNTHFKKNHRPMPYILKLALFLFILGVICSLMLALVNQITSSIIDQQEQEEANETLKDVGLKNGKDVTSNYELSENVVAVFFGKNQLGEEAYVFQLANKNKFTTVSTFVLINAISKKVENIKINGDATTLPSKNELFNTSDFGVIGSTSDNVNDNFQIITGATWSSKSVLEAINAAYAQFNIIQNVNHAGGN